MASSRIDHCRYEIPAEPSEGIAEISFPANSNVNITANDFVKPNNPSGYMGFFSGVYTPSSALIVRYINTHSNGTNTFIAIRNVGTSALNDREIKVKYTYLRSDMIDDQRT